MAEGDNEFSARANGEAANAAGSGAEAADAGVGGGVPVWGYALAVALVLAYFWWRSKQQKVDQEHARTLQDLVSDVQGAAANTKEAKEAALKDAAAIAKYQFTFKAERDAVESLKDKYKAELATIAAANNDKRIARDRAIDEAKKKAAAAKAADADAKAAPAASAAAGATAAATATPTAGVTSSGAPSKATIEVVEDGDEEVESTNASGSVTVSNVKPKKAEGAAAASASAPTAALAGSPTGGSAKAAAEAKVPDSAPILAADGSDPVKVLGAALLRNAMAVVQKATILHHDGNDINRSRRAGFCPDAVFGAYSDAVQRVNDEIEAIKNEAEELRVGWGDSIFPQAGQLVRLNHVKAMKEAKAKHDADAKKENERKAKAAAADEERKKKEAIAKSERDAEAAYRDLMREEDGKKAKKAAKKATSPTASAATATATAPAAVNGDGKPAGGKGKADAAKAAAANADAAFAELMRDEGKAGGAGGKKKKGK